MRLPPKQIKILQNNYNAINILKQAYLQKTPG